jgi:hypothetical protein
MSEPDRKIRDGWNDRADELAQKLDAALAKYAAVEPRAGLEDRILTNLRTKREDLPYQASSRWSWAVAAAVLIIGALFAWRLIWPSRLQVSNHPAAAQHDSLKPAPQIASNAVGPKLMPRHGKTSKKPSHEATAETNPKLDVFPSPQPLSEEELALAQYVRNFPSDAKSVAQAQEASEKEVLAKMQALANESTESN